MLRDAHLAVTAAMAGIIWFVQIVHYPLFGKTLPGYAERHANRTGSLVGPLMLVELALAIAVLVRRPSAASMAALALLAVIWISTFAIQVPLHERLQKQFDADNWRRLVRTNWIRTIAWTGRVLLACAIS